MISVSIITLDINSYRTQCISKGMDLASVDTRQKFRAARHFTSRCKLKANSVVNVTKGYPKYTSIALDLGNHKTTVKF